MEVGSLECSGAEVAIESARSFVENIDQARFWPLVLQVDGPSRAARFEQGGEKAIGALRTGRGALGAESRIDGDLALPDGGAESGKKEGQNERRDHEKRAMPLRELGPSIASGGGSRADRPSVEGALDVVGELCC